MGQTYMWTDENKDLQRSADIAILDRKSAINMVVNSKLENFQIGISDKSLIIQNLYKNTETCINRKWQISEYFLAYQARC